MKAKLAQKRRIAEGTDRFTFDLQGEKLDFHPGQYCFYTLIDPPYEDYRGNRRHFTINNTPNNNAIVEFTTRMRDSGFKRALGELDIGSELEVGPVAGQFGLPEDTQRPIVFIAGGIGITPFLSMLTWKQEEGLEHRITLLYANRNRDSAAYVVELQQMSEQMQEFDLVLTMDKDPDWGGETRRIDPDFIKDYVTDPPSCTFMVAGPPGMDDAMNEAIQQAGVDTDNIRMERFTGYS
jgi:ferredoxin-NADP reductase